jgi:hypothetical protein
MFERTRTQAQKPHTQNIRPSPLPPASASAPRHPGRIFLRAPTPQATAPPLRTRFQCSLSLFLQPACRSWPEVRNGDERRLTVLGGPSGRRQREPSARERGRPHGDEQLVPHGDEQDHCLRVAPLEIPDKHAPFPVGPAHAWRCWNAGHRMEIRLAGRTRPNTADGSKGPASAGWAQNLMPRRHFEDCNATVGERF